MPHLKGNASLYVEAEWGCISFSTSRDESCNTGISLSTWVLHSMGSFIDFWFISGILGVVVVFWKGVQREDFALSEQPCPLQLPGIPVAGGRSPLSRAGHQCWAAWYMSSCSKVTQMPAESPAIADVSHLLITSRSSEGNGLQILDGRALTEAARAGWTGMTALSGVEHKNELKKSTVEIKKWEQRRKFQKLRWIWSLAMFLCCEWKMGNEVAKQETFGA